MKPFFPGWPNKGDHILPLQAEVQGGSDHGLQYGHCRDLRDGSDIGWGQFDSWKPLSVGIKLILFLSRDTELDIYEFKIALGAVQQCDQIWRFFGLWATF